MGYDPQRSRPRPRVDDDAGPAPVDALLDTVADLPPMSDPTPVDVEIVEIIEVETPDIVVVEAELPTADPVAASTPTRASVATAPIEPATPSPARAANPKIIAVAVLVVAALALTFRSLRKRRRRNRA